MATSDLQSTIEAAFEDRDSISPDTTGPTREAIELDLARQVLCPPEPCLCVAQLCWAPAGLAAAGFGASLLLGAACGCAGGAFCTLGLSCPRRNGPTRGRALPHPHLAIWAGQVSW